MNTLKERLIAQIKTEKADLRKKLRELDQKKRLILKAQPNTFAFRVVTTSLWSNEGEKSAVAKVIGTLEQAVAAGIAGHQKMNKRTDWQGSIMLVEATLQDKTIMIIPELWWHSFLPPANKASALKDLLAKLDGVKPTFELLLPDSDMTLGEALAKLEKID